MNGNHRLRELRMEHSLTQAKLAAKIGLSQTVYSRYERGAAALPVWLLLCLCEVYNVSADYIMLRTDKRGTMK